MAGAAKIAGLVLILAGLLVAGVSASRIAGDEEYAKAALLKERNPGNVMYEAEYAGVAIRRAFLITGASGGVLLAINGVTLLLVGVVAARLRTARQP